MLLPPAKKRERKKKKNPGLHKGNTGSQTLDYGLLPTGVDSYDTVHHVELKCRIRETRTCHEN